MGHESVNDYHASVRHLRVSFRSASRVTRKELAAGNAFRKMDSRFLCCRHPVRRNEKSSPLSFRLVGAGSDAASLMNLLATGESR